MNEIQFWLDGRVKDRLNKYLVTRTGERIRGLLNGQEKDRTSTWINGRKNKCLVKWTGETQTEQIYMVKWTGNRKTGQASG